MAEFAPDLTTTRPLPAGSVAQWPRDTVPAVRPDRSLPPAVLALTVVAAAAALGLSLATPFGHPALWALPALGLAIAVTELAGASVQVGRQQWHFSVTDAVLALVLVLAPGTWVVIGLAGGVAVAQLLKRKAAPKIVFNMCQCAASMAAACLVQHVVLGADVPRLSAAAAAIATYCLVQTALVAAIVSVTTRRSPLRVLGSNAPLAIVHTAGSASVGLLAAWLTLTAPAGLVGLLVPVLLLWSSFDQTSRRAAEARLFAELAHGQEQAGGGSVDVSAQVVVTTAARLLGADVTLLLFASDGLLQYAGDEHAAPRRERVPVSAMQQHWIPEVLSGGVVLGVAEGAPSCGMRVGPAERPMALLYALRRPGDGAFSRRDASLARVLIQQAETWLSVADLTASRRLSSSSACFAVSSGLIGSDCPPARCSAKRLARMLSLRLSSKPVKVTESWSG